MSNFLPVPFESQRDNLSGTGHRECFSSSAAMLARYWGRIKNDDSYNWVRRRFGDTTSADAQLRALHYLGLKAYFWTNGRKEDLLNEIAAGRPVAVGWLHKGHVSKPTGGGHWSVVTGTWARGPVMHDPYGEALLVTGGHIPGSLGAHLEYSWRNWLPRWEVEGPRTGWYLTCSR